MVDKKICEKFEIGEVINVNPYGNGHINSTYLVYTTQGKFIIQEINTYVFKKPKKIMKNIYLVTKWMEKRCKNNCYDGLKIIKTKNKKLYYKDRKKYYRCYQFIDSNTINSKLKQDNKMMYEMGKCLATFDTSLSDYPVKKIYTVIPDFHNSKKRYEHFKKIVFLDLLNRRKKVYKEIKFIFKRKKYFDIINNALKEGITKLQVVHNDPKADNMIINNNGNVCLIDLDTVMEGTILYDYGDAMRLNILNSDEDDENVSINLDNFYYFTKGFVTEYEDIPEEEKNLLVKSIIIMTLECGMRFLTDYLEGNIYFKVDDENHNLRRARTAFKEILLLEKNEKLLDSILNNL